VHSIRHALVAAALAGLAVATVSACDQKVDAAALQANAANAAAAQAAADTTTAAAPTTADTAPVTPSAAPDPLAKEAPTSASTTRRAAPSTSRAPRTTAPKSAAPKPVGKPLPPADTSEAGQVLALVNAERAKAGCNPVALDSRLTRAAAGHSQDMAAHDYFAHDSQDGTTFDKRITATGYTRPRSENIAAGQPTPAAVMDAWMNSPGHKANILDCSTTQMGLASARGGSYGIYWTQDFGTA
jgi:uncharacterized protein YkwD